MVSQHVVFYYIEHSSKEKAGFEIIMSYVETYASMGIYHTRHLAFT